MFDQLREFLGRLSGDAASSPGEEDPRVAAAALMAHVARADGVFAAEEAARLRGLLVDEYGVSAAEADAIAAAGQRADEDAVDLFRFTRVLAAHLDEDERVRFVTLLWDVTFADGALHELEDNLIWRISELLGVAARDRMLGKRAISARTGP